MKKIVLTTLAVAAFAFADAPALTQHVKHVTVQKVKSI